MQLTGRFLDCRKDIHGKTAKTVFLHLNNIDQQGEGTIFFVAFQNITGDVFIPNI